MEFFNVAALQRLANKSQPFIKTMAAWRKFYNTLSKDIPAKNALVVSLHSEIDSLIKDYFNNPMQDKPTCKKGCSFCCHLYVTISKNEAKLLKDAAKDLGVKIDMDKLKKQANFSQSRWLFLPFKDRSCVFLKAGECSVYEFRPASCRTYHVVSPPANCDTEHHPNTPVTLTWDIDAEALGELIREKEGSGSLPQMLLNEINKK